MQVIFDEDAHKDLKKMDQGERILFHQHVWKLIGLGRADI